MNLGKLKQLSVSLSWLTLYGMDNLIVPPYHVYATAPSILNEAALRCIYHILLLGKHARATLPIVFDCHIDVM